jgi:hypothetical protein
MSAAAVRPARSSVTLRLVVPAAKASRATAPDRPTPRSRAVRVGGVEGDELLAAVEFLADALALPALSVARTKASPATVAAPLRR